MVRTNTLFRFMPIVMLCCSWTAAVRAVEPGTPLECNDVVIYPDRWAESNTSTKLFPWYGQEIVFLTTRDDLDRDIMARLLERLDMGWQLYTDLTGRQPGRHKHLDGKPTMVAVPSAEFTCGYGCGYVGVTGIEYAGFYDRDVSLLRSNPKAMPHYYFYEMGRNFYVFEDRHSLFITGYAVFMRYICMDLLRYEDPDMATRHSIEAAEERFAESGMGFLEGFTTVTGLDEKVPRLKDEQGEPIVPSDQPVIYASAMLKLYRECGGRPWLKRFFAQLAACPPVDPENEEAALRQCLNWLVSASCAARKDLSPVFVNRWRMPVSPQMRQGFAAIDWADPSLAAAQILRDLVNLSPQGSSTPRPIPQQPNNSRVRARK